MNDAFDFDESEASAREEREQLRPLPMLFAVFVAGMFAGALLALCLRN